MTENEERLINIEVSLANCEKTIEELNSVVIEQGKIINSLINQYKKIVDSLSSEGVKPLGEETPPPHY
ncbi:MAG: SlyX family protein [Lactobacillaceae bacterium]|jgi:uncharacterized coiled-coil protein SlyX|nr:SlyX family protein [Lactobacillaceae bacterium]